MSDPEPSDDVDGQAEAWVVRMDARPLAPAERRRLEAWLATDPGHRRALERAQACWAELDDLAAPAEQGALPTSSARTARGRRSALALAASVLVAVIALTGAWLTGSGDRIRAEGATETVRLSDGSRVVLERGSAISVAYAQSSRRVHLHEGRAWFDVAAGERAFRVQAGAAAVEVTGTAFEVARHGGRSLVRVAEGRVQVAGDGGPAVTLRRGDRARVTAAGVELARSAIEPGAVAAWRDGLLRFRDRRVSDVLDVLGRHSDGWLVRAADLPGDRRISATLRADRPAAAVDAVAELLGLEVTRTFGLVILHR